jgi:hypothetical protein
MVLSVSDHSLITFVVCQLTLSTSGIINEDPKKLVIHYLSKIKREVKLQRCWSEGVLSLTLSSCRKPEKLIWRKYI